MLGAPDLPVLFPCPLSLPRWSGICLFLSDLLLLLPALNMPSSQPCAPRAPRLPPQWLCRDPRDGCAIALWWQTHPVTPRTPPGMALHHLLGSPVRDKSLPEERSCGYLEKNPAEGLLKGFQGRHKFLPGELFFFLDIFEPFSARMVFWLKDTRATPLCSSQLSPARCLLGLPRTPIPRQSRNARKILPSITL